MGEGEKSAVGVGLVLTEEIGEVDGVAGVVAFADDTLLAGGEGEIAGTR